MLALDPVSVNPISSLPGGDVTIDIRGQTLEVGLRTTKEIFVKDGLYGIGLMHTLELPRQSAVVEVIGQEIKTEVEKVTAYCVKNKRDESKISVSTRIAISSHDLNVKTETSKINSKLSNPIIIDYELEEFIMMVANM